MTELPVKICSHDWAVLGHLLVTSPTTSWSCGDQSASAQPVHFPSMILVVLIMEIYFNVGFHFLMLPSWFCCVLLWGPFRPSEQNSWFGVLDVVSALALSPSLYVPFQMIPCHSMLPKRVGLCAVWRGQWLSCMCQPTSMLGSFWACCSAVCYDIMAL